MLFWVSRSQRVYLEVVLAATLTSGTSHHLKSWAGCMKWAIRGRSLRYFYWMWVVQIILIFTMRYLQLANDRLKAKIASMTESQGVALDEQTSSDFDTIMKKVEPEVKKSYPEGSFQQLFWDQQRQASARQKNGRRWHPMMIKWCIYLHHQSSKAYEALRDSGCIQLPSSRTVRDYTNCIKVINSWETNAI